MRRAGPSGLGWHQAGVKRVLEGKGRLGWGEYVRCRVRYFSDGVVVGSREIVEGMFGRFRGTFSPLRRSRARRMRGLREELYTLRDLRVEVLG